MTKRVGDPEKNQLLLGNDDELNLTIDDLSYVFINLFHWARPFSLMILKCLTIILKYSQMFHPDNIKNFTLDGVPVAISLH